MLTPLNFFDKINHSLQHLNMGIDILFAVDCIKQFFTGYIDESGSVELKQRKIVTHYLRGWFMVDFIALIPVDLIIANTESQVVDESQLTGSETNVLKAFRLLRLAKIARLLRATRIFRYIRYSKRVIEEKLHVTIPAWVSKVSMLTLLVLLVAHWLGSLQFLIAKIMDFPRG